MTIIVRLLPMILLAGCVTSGNRDKEIWIDVRTPEEFREGHLPGARNIPHDVIEKNIESVSTDKDAPIRLYCHSGRRSAIALEKLTEMGYTDVTNEGSYEEIRERREENEAELKESADGPSPRIDQYRRRQHFRPSSRSSFMFQKHRAEWRQS